jgi:serine/threonine-protein kinase PpkA
MSLQSHGNTLPPGYRLHWYRIESVLGQGGFGITYLALDTNLDKQVAIKEYLPIELAVREGDATVRAFTEDRRDQFIWGLTRFVEEGRTLAALDHPNIVRVHTVFEENATAYMVMAYEVGETLGYLAKFARLESEAAVLAIAHPLLDALEHMHSVGFVHRDVKPTNVVVRPDGAPVLLDFGSARLALGEQTRTLTSVVSPGFAPYEQYYSESAKQGPWTDIYGLGATLYAVINRSRGPLDALVRGSARIEDKPDPMEPAQSIGANRYSPQLLKAIDAALGFTPVERPQTTIELRALLPSIDEVPDAEPDEQAKTFMFASAASPLTAESASTRQAMQDTVLAPSLGLSSSSSSSSSSLRRLLPYALALLLLVVLGAGYRWREHQRQSESALAPQVTEQQRKAAEALRLADEQTKAVQAVHLAEQQRKAVEALRVVELQRQAAQAAQLAEQQRAAGVAAQLAERQRKEAAAARLVEQQGKADELARSANHQRIAEDLKLASIQALLSAAEGDIAALRLTNPPGANAVDKYRKVLALDADNAPARAGMQAVVDRYVALAGEVSAKGELDKAQVYLERAAQLLPDAPGVHTARAALLAAREQSKQAVRQAVTDMAPNSAFRDALEDGSKGPQMVTIPAGPFRMGDLQGDGPAQEKPTHALRVERAFAMGRTEITFEDYERFARASGRGAVKDEGWGRGRRPVINLSWDDANAYAQWLSAQTGKRYRLPSEAEWEYAARAGTETARYWGNDADAACQYANVKNSADSQVKRFVADHHNCTDGYAQTAPVGRFAANAFGLKDMLGNVWEWTADCWHGNYSAAPQNTAAWQSGDCARRVLRGGSWRSGPPGVRSAVRLGDTTGHRASNLGFRLARDL